MGLTNQELQKRKGLEKRYAQDVRRINATQKKYSVGGKIKALMAIVETLQLMLPMYTDENRIKDLNIALKASQEGLAQAKNYYRIVRAFEQRRKLISMGMSAAPSQKFTGEVKEADVLAEKASKLVTL